MTVSAGRSFGKRWKSAVLVFAATLVAPVFVSLITGGDAIAIGSYLKWPMRSPYVAFVMDGAFVLAAACAVIVFWLAKRPWWIWCAVVVWSVAAALSWAPFAQAWTSLGQEFISVSPGWPFPARHYDISNVQRIDVRCGYFRLNRFSSAAGIDYVLTLKDGEIITASSGTYGGGGKRDAGQWLITLDRWDSQPGLGSELIKPSRIRSL
ncbi:MAG: hypothetical protein K5831_12395 [Brevundimonas sp.]|uniref:hypothetical protein n=1 Tax=Brevundimonas sp. TaxID=1871086 RepID=UPI00258F1E03|nr:hypothetical protein [Brevundimonas sp.]MCV0415662.1 hypothetical protein [Brevundimonas sp.]